MDARHLNPFHILRNRHRILPTLGRWRRQLGIPWTPSDQRLRQLKDSLRGRRAVILGNGPSLKIPDLHRLRGEVTFASNKIFLAFDQTEWRPTFYSVTDRLVASNNAARIRELKLEKILSDFTLPFLPECADITWVHERVRNSFAFEHASEEDARKPAPYFSTNAFVGVDSGDTVIYFQLQLAYFFGIREVYLIGVDFSFNTPTTVVDTGILTQQKGLVSQGEVNHFHPDYRKAGEVWGVPRLDRQYRAFLRARLAFEEGGGAVFNASRQTKLDAFERRDFDATFPP
ncbi:MAG: 6-hydroxymethylpterin diphosphokinase MptE-like protein [Limisphaerales bacterium]